MAHSGGFAELRRLLAIGHWASGNGVPAASAKGAFERELNRRTMLRGGAAVVAAAAIPLVGGCGTDDDDSTLPRPSAGPRPPAPHPRPAWP